MQTTYESILKGKQLPWLLLLISIGYAIFVICHSLSLMLKHPHLVPIREKVSSSSTNSSPEIELILADLDKMQLFGKATSPTQHIQESRRADLKVKGISARSQQDPEKASAILQLAQGEEKVVLLGDHLADGSVIRRIEAKKIIIEHEGHLEALKLDEPPTLFG